MIHSLNINDVNKLTFNEINGLLYLITLDILSKKLPKLYYILYLYYHKKDDITIDNNFITKNDIKILTINKLNNFILEIDKLNSLNKFGINHTVLFPEIDEVSEYLKKK